MKIDVAVSDAGPLHYLALTINRRRRTHVSSISAQLRYFSLSRRSCSKAPKLCTKQIQTELFVGGISTNSTVMSAASPARSCSEFSVLQVKIPAFAYPWRSSQLQSGAVLSLNRISCAAFVDCRTAIVPPNLCAPPRTRLKASPFGTGNDVCKVRFVQSNNFTCRVIAVPSYIRFTNFRDKAAIVRMGTTNAESCRIRINGFFNWPSVIQWSQIVSLDRRANTWGHCLLWKVGARTG